MNLPRLVRSELLKLRTTRTWWIFAVCSLVSTALSGGVRLLQLQFLLRSTSRMPPSAMTKLDPVHMSSELFTSGQFLGCLLAMLLGILLVTSEYQHQTATTTFLTTPKRTPVILAKLVTALITAGALWVIPTVIDVVGGSMFLSSKALPNHLGDTSILEGMLLNLMIYVLWSAFGVGWGVLLRGQLGATISASLGYVLGSEVALVVFRLVHQLWIEEDWVFTAMVVVPTKAAEIAVSPTPTYLQSPAQWVGVVVMIAYGAGLGAIGTLIIRKRDVT